MADPGSKPSNTRDAKPAERSRWLTIASAAVVAGLIAAIGYYGLKYVRDTSYQDERAFRVLGHIVGQFGNLQEALAGALVLAPNESDCDGESTGAAVRSCQVRRLALRGRVTLGLVRPGEASQSQTPTLCQAPFFAIHTARPERSFCFSNERLRLSGPLRDQVPIFVTQALFETVAIATAEGKVLTTIPQGDDRSQHVQLHSVIGTDLFGGDVKGLLRKAAEYESTGNEPLAKNEKPPATDRKVPENATVYAASVAGPQYRVFVLPFEPARQTKVDNVEAPRLYLIGLKRQDILRSVSDALGSGGALVLTLGVLLSVLAWPFISLRLSSPQEAIAPTQVVAILLALVLIPAVLTTAGFSFWTRWRLTLWADQHAEIYARRVEQTLIDEMDCGVHILEQLARELVADPTITNSNFELEDGQTRSAPRVNPRVTCKKVFENAPQGWSPIRLAAPLNVHGRSRGLAVSFFHAAPPAKQLDLQDREYYQAIMAGEDWRPGTLWPNHVEHAQRAPDHRYVAQRLFNRTDAARALQLSVPMETDGKRIGLVTGDTRAYGLSAGLRPPLLRFAIFDQRNGALLFHTEDRSSLAENLLTETENNASLVEAMNKRASTRSARRIQLEDHFEGRYTGADHRFYHRAISGAPWGLLVFYETDLIDTVVLQTAVATLATYFLVVIVAALLLGVLAVALPMRADIVVLERIWPKWTSHRQYRWIALGTLALLATLALTVAGRLSDRLPQLTWTRWLGIAAILLITSALLAGISRAARPLAARFLKPRAPSVKSYERLYVAAVFGVLCLVSAVPTVIIAIGYHDTSVHAFIRDELLQATRDEEQRRRTLFLDDRRFNDSTSVDPERAETLSQTLPVPGYVYVAHGNPSPYWRRTDADPSPWLSGCGPETLGRIRRIIWAMSTARQVQRPFASSATDVNVDRADDKDGTAQNEQTRLSNPCRPLAVRAWRRSDDGTVVSAALPLASVSREFIAIAPCTSGGRPQQACRDPELHTRYTASSGAVLLSTTLGCALLILLLSAHVSRRLFGVRIPFAGRFTPSTGDAASTSALLDLELEMVRLKNAGEPLTSKDAADWRAFKCDPIYKGMWEGLSAQEQLLLRHLADGRYANPENQLVIEQLLRRGYVTLAPWPRIVEPGLADFARRVQPSQELHELRHETAHTPWNQWRTPLLIIVVIIAGLLMWLAGSAMHILAGTLAGVATLFGSITQVTNFIQREKPPS